MNDATSQYWRKLIRIDEPVTPDYLRQYRSQLEIFRPLFYAVTDLVCRFYFRVKVKGIENLPSKPPYIISPNHVSALDQTMVSYAIGKAARVNMYTLTAKHFYDRLVPRFFIKIAANAVRIDNAVDFFPALRAATKVLKLEKSVYVNPEGTRSESGELLPFHVGVGVIAVETGVPIVPVYISGTFESMPPGKFFPKPSRVTVSIGKPIYMSAYSGKIKTERAYDVYKEVTDELFKRVGLLKVGDKNI